MKSILRTFKKNVAAATISFAKIDEFQNFESKSL